MNLNGKVVNSMNGLDTLWQQYAEQGDVEAREALIIHYSPLVRTIVRGLKLTLPQSLEVDDLVGYGIMGLINAVDRFDLSHQVKFESYATQRIRGQIIDALRSLDIVPRSTYSQYRTILETESKLTAVYGRQPTETEMANDIGISLNEYIRWERDARCVILSLDEPIPFKGEKVMLLDALEDDTALSPADEMDEKDLQFQISCAVESLSVRERRLLALYYDDELSMREIAPMLGVSESRVSQIHTRIMEKLQRIIKQQAEPKPQLVERKSHRLRLGVPAERRFKLTGLAA